MILTAVVERHHGPNGEELNRSVISSMWRDDDDAAV